MEVAERFVRIIVIQLGQQLALRRERSVREQFRLLLLQPLGGPLEHFRQQIELLPEDLLLDLFLGQFRLGQLLFRGWAFRLV